MIVKVAPSMDKENKYDEYSVEHAARTLMEAEEIKQDSKMMGLVAKHLKKKKKAIESIDDLRELANKSDDED